MNSNRNLWPLGIISAFVIFIAGTIGLIVLACSSPSDLVAKDYYEQELRFQGQMDRKVRAQKLERRASVSYDAASRRIKIFLPSEHSMQNATGTIQLYRPSASGLDRRLELRTDPDGNQSIDASKLKPGSWKVRVLWTAGPEEFYMDEPIVVTAAKE